MLLVIALYILAFTLFVLLVLYPCGSLILGSRGNTVLRINVGLVTSVIVYFILSILKLNFLVIPALLTPLVYVVLRKKLVITKPKIDWLVITVICLVTLIQSSINFTSGDLVNGGLKLINIHNHDSMWMVALTESVERGIPPQNPGYPMAQVQNYHIFLNIFVAVTKTFTGIPILPLYLKIISPFLLLMFSVTSYMFIKKLTGSKWLGIGGVLIMSLAGNLYYLAGIFYPQASVTPSSFWVNEYETHIVNYQLLLSYIILVSWLYLLVQKKKSLLLLSLLAGSLIAFKSFASVVLIPSLGLIALIDLFKREYFFLKLSLLTTFFTLIFYLCSNPTWQSQFIVQPFYLIETMLITNDHLNYPDWILKIQTYISENNIKRVIQFYSEGILVFILGNLGLRVLGFKILLKDNITKLLGFMSIFGIIASLTLVSKGLAWNSLQFFYFSVLSSSILFVYFVWDLSVKHKSLAITLFLITWIGLLPGVFYTTKSYLSQMGKVIDNRKIYQAAIFLSKLPKGIVEVDQKYSDTSFVPAISGQETFLTNPGMLDIQLINYKYPKKPEIKYILKETDGKILIYQSGNPVPLQTIY